MGSSPRCEAPYVVVVDGEAPRKEIEAWQLLTVYIRIQLRLDLQADKSSVVVKGPFFPQV
jgi:hypothetical protein